METSRPATAAACTMTIVKDVPSLDALQNEWVELYDSSPTASTPLRFEWIRQWWQIFGKIYGDAGRGMRILTIRRNQNLIGVLPLYESQAGNALLGIRRLQFITAGAAEFEETCAEYLNLLHAPGEEDACIDLIASTLLNSTELRWDELLLIDMPDDSPLQKLMLRLEGNGRVIATEPRPPCYISNLKGGMEAFYQELSTGTRKKARKLRKDIVAANIRFEIAKTKEEAGEYFDQMVVLHKKRWAEEGKTGSFSPRHAEFHRAISLQLVPMGEVYLARLIDADGPIAVCYGHRVGNSFDNYQIGVDRNSQKLQSPGTALHLEVMAHLVELGVLSYDHLVGVNRFKTDYAKHLRGLMNIKVTRPTIRSSAYEAAEYARRGFRKMTDMLSSRTSKPVATVNQD